MRLKDQSCFGLFLLCLLLQLLLGKSGKSGVLSEGPGVNGGGSDGNDGDDEEDFPTGPAGNPRAKVTRKQGSTGAGQQATTVAMQNQQMAQQMQAAAAAVAAANGGHPTPRSAATDRQGVFFPQMGYMPQLWNYPVQRLSQNCPAGMLSENHHLFYTGTPSFGLIHEFFEQTHNQGLRQLSLDLFTWDTHALIVSMFFF